MIKQTGGPAFPLSGEWSQIKEKGMTLRDYFAAKAMQAEMTQGIHENDFVEIAARFYKIADAMLEARK
jgi:hypothetical protein